MIEFECPECGEPMEIGERSAGRRVRCLSCDEMIDVPEYTRRRRLDDRNEGLSGTEWLLFTLLFLAIPAANVLVSSVLYYVWRGSQPRRANQINLLGFAIFGCHVLLGCLLITVAAAFGGR